MRDTLHNSRFTRMRYILRIITYEIIKELCKTNPILSAVGVLQMNPSAYMKMAYKNFIPPSGHKNKPNQTQFKANSNPIAKRAKMNLNQYITTNYKVFPRLPGKKTNPIKPNQTQNKPILETAHTSDIYQRNSLSLISRRPIITCECYGHNDGITLNSMGFIKCLKQKTL